MQPPRAEQGLEYASLAWRFLAVIVDMMIAFFIFFAIYMLAVAAGWARLPQYTDLQSVTAKQDIPIWFYPVYYTVVFLYFTLFELRSASPGKRMCGMTVLSDDGTPPTATAIVVRNMIRIPELIFYYIPSGISCLASTKNKRLGDLAAHTIVVRRGAFPVSPGVTARPLVGGAPPVPSTRVVPPSPLDAVPAGAGETPWSVAPPAPPAPAPAAAAVAIGELKTAALALSGAHHLYLQHSAVELAAADARPGTAAEAHADAVADARADAPTSASPDTTPVARPDTMPVADEPEPPGAYAPGYVAAWFTLTDAVASYHRAVAAAGGSAAAAGMSLSEAVAEQPDLTALMDALRPYLQADSDAAVHDAYLSVARAELPPQEGRA